MRRGYSVANHNVQHEVEVFYQEGVRGLTHEEGIFSGREWGSAPLALTGQTVRKDDSSMVCMVKFSCKQNTVVLGVKKHTSLEKVKDHTAS